MEVIAFVIGLDPLLTRGQQLVDQFRTSSKNRKDAPELQRSFNSFARELANYSTHLKTEAAKLPQQTREIIDSDVETLGTYLKTAHKVLEDITNRLNRNQMLQFFRANAIARDCDTLAKELDEAQKLFREISKHVALSSQLRSEAQSIKEGQSKPLIDSFREFFPPTSSSVRAVLDFDDKDEAGNPRTTEALVKQYLLIEETNDCPRVVILHGIGGVGKSTILQALSIDDQIRRRFPDGVHVIKLGKDASDAILLRQLCQVLKDSGAEKTYQSLRTENDMDAVLHFFESWFDRKTCAFLIDDVWVHCVGLSLLSRLCNIGNDGEKRVLITSREPQVASLVPDARTVLLEPRQARGLDAQGILFFHAGRQEMDPSDTLIHGCISRILDICAGLPVALAVAGKNVRMMSISMLIDEEDVWMHYLSQLEMCQEQFLNQNVGTYDNLFATFATSIAILDKQHPEQTLTFMSTMSFAEIYRRLCVLQKQVAVPESMLKHLWQTKSVEDVKVIANKFVQFGLASLEAVRVGERCVWCLGLHDSLHDFAVAESKRSGDNKEAHECLLNGYQSCDEETSYEWWSQQLEADGYIHRNLCRHLMEAGRVSELVYLLLSPLWVGRQLEVNDILFLQADFSLGKKAIQEGLIDDAEENRRDIEEALELISDAAALSSMVISGTTSVELYFQLHGRLKEYGKTRRRISEYISLIEADRTRPRMLCETNFLQQPGGANIKIIPIGDPVWCMAMMDEERIACGCLDGRIFVVNVKRNAVEIEWKAHTRTVNAIVVARDLTRLISVSNDGTAKMWEVESGRCVTCFNDHDDHVNDIAMMRDGRRAFSVSWKGIGYVWDVETGKTFSKFTGHYGSIGFVTVSVDEKELVITGGKDKTLKMWNLATGEQIGSTFDGHERFVQCVALTPNGQYVISGSEDGTIRVWNVGSQQQIGNPLRGHTNWVLCVAINEDGCRVVSGSLDNTIRVWDLESRTEICEPLEGHTGPITGVSFRGDHIFSCSKDGTLRIWDVTRKHSKKSTSRHAGPVSSVSFSPDGRSVVSGSWDKALCIWDTTSGEHVGNPLEGHSDGVREVAVTSNGQCILSVSDDKTLRVWDLESFELRHSLIGHTDFVMCVAVTPQGDSVVTGSGDTTVRVWSLTTMDGSHVVLEGHNAPVLRVFVSDDGLRVVSVDNKRNIFVWELRARKLVKQVTKQSGWKLSRREVLNLVGETTVQDDTELSIPLRGRKIVYGEEPGETILATMESDIDCWALSPDKNTICVGLSDGQVGFMKLET